MIQRKAAISIILVFIGLVLLSGCAPLAVMGGEGTRVRATLRKIILRKDCADDLYDGHAIF